MSSLLQDSFLPPCAVEISSEISQYLRYFGFRGVFSETPWYVASLIVLMLNIDNNDIENDYEYAEYDLNSL